MPAPLTQPHASHCALVNVLLQIPLASASFAQPANVPGGIYRCKTSASGDFARTAFDSFYKSAFFSFVPARVGDIFRFLRFLCVSFL